MADGLVDIAPLNKDLCTEDMQKAVDEAKAKLEDGSFNVFDGVIETNDGKTVGEEGKTLDDATITGGINWCSRTLRSSNKRLSNKGKHLYRRYPGCRLFY